MICLKFYICTTNIVICSRCLSTHTPCGMYTLLLFIIRLYSSVLNAMRNVEGQGYCSNPCLLDSSRYKFCKYVH